MLMVLEVLARLVLEGLVRSGPPLRTLISACYLPSTAQLPERLCSSVVIAIWVVARPHVTIMKSCDLNDGSDQLLKREFHLVVESSIEILVRQQVRSSRRLLILISLVSQEDASSLTSPLPLAVRTLRYHGFIWIYALWSLASTLPLKIKLFTTACLDEDIEFLDAPRSLIDQPLLKVATGEQSLNVGGIGHT